MEGIYHVYNRTIAKEPALALKENQFHLIKLIDYYRYQQKTRYSFFTSYTFKKQKEYLESITTQKPLVTLFAFAMMPNHFHLLLKTRSKTDMSHCISTFQNSFAKYYNLKYKRDGSLFQRQYKCRAITSNADFFGVSRYIHLNPLSANLMNADKLQTSFTTSIPFYKKKPNSDFIDTDIILITFGSFERYWRFLTSPDR